jgi:hypothetical protein
MSTRQAPSARSRSISRSRSRALLIRSIGYRHEAHADGRVLAGPDDDLALTLGQNLPAGCLRPESGQPRQVVNVNDDVVEPDRNAFSMRGHAGRHPAKPPASNATAYLGGAITLLIAEATRHRSLPTDSGPLLGSFSDLYPTSSGAGMLTRTHGSPISPCPTISSVYSGPGPTNSGLHSPFCRLSTLTASPGKPKVGCTYPMSGTT